MFCVRFHKDLSHKFIMEREERWPNIGATIIYRPDGLSVRVLYPPGIIMRTKALLNESPYPGEKEIKEALRDFSLDSNRYFGTMWYKNIMGKKDLPCLLIRMPKANDFLIPETINLEIFFNSIQRANSTWPKLLFL